MRDTPPEVQARYRALLLARTPAERLEMAGDMFAAAKALALGGIWARFGDLEPAELRVQLFLRLYGNDFAPEQRKRLEARLRAWAREHPTQALSTEGM